MPQPAHELPSRATRETILTHLKNRYVSSERAPRTVIGGTFRGPTMSLTLRTQLQLYLGLAEREPSRWVRRMTRSIATAIDIGASDGDYTLFLLARTSASKFWGFEPNMEIIPLLLENLRLNGLCDSKRLALKHIFRRRLRGRRHHNP